MKIILDEEDFEYMNRIRNSDKLIMQKGETYLLECVVEEPEKAQNFLFGLIDSKLVKNKFMESTGIRSPRLSYDLKQEQSHDNIQLKLSQIDHKLDIIQDNINNIKKDKE